MTFNVDGTISFTEILNADKFWEVGFNTFIFDGLIYFLCIVLNVCKHSYDYCRFRDINKTPFNEKTLCLQVTQWESIKAYVDVCTRKKTCAYNNRGLSIVIKLRSTLCFNEKVHLEYLRKVIRGRSPLLFVHFWNMVFILREISFAMI